MSTHQTELFKPERVTGDGIKPTLEENISFAESIAALRKDREYSILECAEITRHPSKTFENWATGHRTPCRQTQAHVLAALADPANPPSAKVQRRAEESHHLIWDKQKGWEMRVTFLIRRKKKVGHDGKAEKGKVARSHRHRERLKTRSLEEAIVRRDIVVSSMKRLGLEIVDRRQKRKTEIK